MQIRKFSTSESLVNQKAGLKRKTTKTAPESDHLVTKIGLKNATRERSRWTPTARAAYGQGRADPQIRGGPSQGPGLRGTAARKCCYQLFLINRINNLYIILYIVYII